MIYLTALSKVLPVLLSFTLGGLSLSTLLTLVPFTIVTVIFPA